MFSPVNILPSRGVHREFFFLLCFLLCFLYVFSYDSDELQILLQVKSAFQKSNTPVLDSWKSGTSPCNFTGIFCDKQSVTQIDLPGHQLVGALPIDLICKLQSLEMLNLGSNLLSGTISKGLNNCTKLTYLDLSMNSFSGVVPDFPSLTGLTFLNVNNTGFSGVFPWKSLENITGLEFLSVGDNLFENSSFPVEILKLDRLYRLYLTNCSLQGGIPPEIGNLTELANLELSDNALYGQIPPEINKLKKLWQLELYDNSLTGELPVGFGNLSSLKNFDASANNLEGDLSELKSLTQLVSLQLFYNKFSGQVPVEFGDFKFLVNLSLYANMLTGNLPPMLGSWADFDFIDVSENYLTGPIPSDMCKRGTMTALLMLQNKFTGGIPETYEHCLSMNRFRVSNNSLSGSVPPGIWGLPNLDLVDLAMNQFDGPLTSEIGNAKKLTQLHLQSNRFSGQLPSEITKASSLVLIDLSSNQFSGQIPASIGELKMLNSLYLQENMFLGSIPDSVASCSHLNNINLADNSFTGAIPASLGSLPSLNSLNLSHNELSSRIPTSLSSPKLSLLDLSNNRLTGPIPHSLSIQAYNGSFAGNPDLCSQNIQYFRKCSSDSGKASQIRTLITCFLAGTAVLLMSLACFIFMKKKSKDDERSMKSDSWDVKSFSILSFTEQDILNSIKQENIIGTGGSGNVYRVGLANGNDLAVKHIWKSDSGNRKSSRSSATMLMKRSGNLPEFDAEVETLSSIRHVNVVKLYCSITSEDSSLLVYEYLPNGSLWDRLHTCNKKMDLDWETRYEIAVGAAKGLEYLHHGCDRPVIHRDVKSSNILLDEFFKPRIADFGLAKIALQAASTGGKGTTAHIITGTHGYIAPGWRPDSISRPYDNIFSSTFQKIRDLGAAQSVILGIDPATATPLLSDPELASIGKYSAPFFRPPPPKERKPRITSPPQKKRRTAAPSHRHPPARHTTHRSTAPTPYRSLKTWEDQYSPSHSSSPSSPPSSMGANKRKLFDSDSDEDVVAAAPQSTIVPPSPPPASKRPRPSDHGEGPPSKAAIPPTAPPQVEQRPGKEVASRADKEADEPIPPFCPSFKLRNRTLTVKDSALKNPAVASSLFYGSHLPVDMAYAEGGSFESHRTSFYTGWEKMSLDISYMIRGLFGARARIDELDKEVADLAEKNSAADLDKLRAQDELRTAEAAHLAYMNAAALQRESLQEKHAAALDSLSHKHQEALEALRAQHEADMEELRDIYRAQAEKRVVKKVREEIDRLTKEGRLLPEAPATTPLPEVVVPVQDSASEGRDVTDRVAEAIDTAADLIIEEAAESVIQDSIVP